MVKELLEDEFKKFFENHLEGKTFHPKATQKYQNIHDFVLELVTPLKQDPVELDEEIYEPDIYFIFKEKKIGLDLKTITKKSGSLQATLTSFDESVKDYQKLDQVYLLWIRVEKLEKDWLQGIKLVEWEIGAIPDYIVKKKSSYTLTIQWNISQKLLDAKQRKETIEDMKKRDIWYEIET